MTKDEALEDLNSIINDCEDGAQYCRDGEPNPWDVHSWLAMAEILSNIKEHIIRINKEKYENMEPDVGW